MNIRSLRKLIRSYIIAETRYRATAPKRYNLSDVEVEADSTREAGNLASIEFAKQGARGIDPFSIELEEVGNTFDDVASVIKAVLAKNGLAVKNEEYESPQEMKIIFRFPSIKKQAGDDLLDKIGRDFTIAFNDKSSTIDSVQLNNALNFDWSWIESIGEYNAKGFRVGVYINKEPIPDPGVYPPRGSSTRAYFDAIREGDWGKRSNIMILIES